MSEIGVFIDTADLYHKTLRLLDGKISYDKLMEKIKEEGEVKVAFAYGMRGENSPGKFIYCLQALGFKTLFKKPRVITFSGRSFRQCDWNVQLTVDVFKALEQIDTIIIGSTNGALIPLLRRLIELGWKDKVKIIGCGASDTIRKIIGDNNIIEIDDNNIIEEEEEE